MFNRDIFKRLLGNLDTLTALKQRFRLNATLTSWNEGEVEQMMTLAHGYGIPLNISMTLTPNP